jgi:predicted transglutaminase-like cysteine proteinase
MSIAIVRTPYGEMHAILLVRTEAGEVVLDNLTSQIKSWRDVPYTWLERQTPGQPLVWVSLNEPQRGASKGA